MDNDYYVVSSFDNEERQAKWMNERYRSGYKFVSMVMDSASNCITVLMEKVK